MQSPVKTGGTTSLFLAFIAKTCLKLIRHVASLKGVPVVVISLLKGSLTRYFDPAFWKYESAQAKIIVYYPRNEVKSCKNSPLPNRE
jgi:hypothetical protein